MKLGSIQVSSVDPVLFNAVRFSSGHRVNELYQVGPAGAVTIDDKMIATSHREGQVVAVSCVRTVSDDYGEFRQVYEFVVVR